MNKDNESSNTGNIMKHDCTEARETSVHKKHAKQDLAAFSQHNELLISSDAQLRSSTMSATPATFIGLGILALFAAGLALWMIYVPVNAAISVPAEVIFKSKRQTVQHLEGGIVEKILVKDGEMVQAGQALIVLEDKQVQPIVKMLQEQNVAERVQMSRLEAESRGFKSFGSAVKESDNKYVQTEHRLFQARQEAYLNQIELIQIQISQIKESLRGAEERLALKDQEIASIKEQLAANQDLAKEGYVTKTVILDLQKLIAANSGEREAIKSAIANDIHRIAEFEQRIITLKSDRVQGVVTELKQSSLRHIDQEERIRPLRDTLERQVIKAPVTGRVVGLKISTVGATIMPREQLMEIAPAGETLILEAKIEMKDVSDVKIGQKADVMISGFDTRKTLPLKAKVNYISDDRIMPTSPAQGQMPYYAAYLEFEPDTAQNMGAYKLIPGMSAIVMISIAPRTAFDYMVGPLKTRAQKALQVK